MKKKFLAAAFIAVMAASCFTGCTAPEQAGDNPNDDKSSVSFFETESYGSYNTPEGDESAESSTEDSPGNSRESIEDDWKNRMILRLESVVDINEGVSGLLYDLNNDNIPEAILYIPCEDEDIHYTVCYICGFSSDMKYYYEALTNIASETYAKISVVSSTLNTERPYICLIGDNRTEYDMFVRNGFTKDYTDCPKFNKEPRVIIVDDNTELPIIDDLTEWVNSWKGNPEPVIEQPETFKAFYDSFKLRKPQGECVTYICPEDPTGSYDYYCKRYV